MGELITVVENSFILSAEASSKIAEFERKAKEIKDAEDKLKKAILEEMESKGVIQLSTRDITISYIAPTTRENLDSKTLKEELPDIYDTYCKISPVKPSIRVKIN